MNGEGLEGNSGITLRIQPGATKLLIYLQGGGLCADDTTCAGVRNPNGLSLDPNVLIIRDWTLEGGVFFADPLFEDAHQVFVHYCSGDVHAGNSPTPAVAPGSAIDGRVYTGRENLKAFLSRLVPTFGEAGIHPVDEVCWPVRAPAEWAPCSTITWFNKLLGACRSTHSSTRRLRSA